MSSTDFVWGGYPVVGGDIPVRNTGSTALSAGACVIPDTSNVLSATLGAIGVVNAGLTADGVGFVLEAIPAGQNGRMRVYGVAVGIAAAAGITTGSRVMCAASGQLQTCGAASPQVGYALSAGDTAGAPMLVLIDRGHNA